MTDTIGLVWLSDDLRLHDNPLVGRAVRECERLIFCYFVEPDQLRQDIYGCRPLGKHRQQFLAETLRSLQSELEQRGQKLNVFVAPAVSSIESICAHLPITHIYRSKPVAFAECQRWATLRASIPDLQFVSEETRCLFEFHELGFDLEALPTSFSKFRKQLEKSSPRVTDPPVGDLPKSLSLKAFSFERADPATWINNANPFACGGEDSALKHVAQYFASGAADHYKSTRNEFDGWLSSSKWSLWLANGSLSARHLAQALRNHQSIKRKTEENDWLMFELLWREYFQWYARAHANKLFLLHGLGPRRTQGSFYAQRFQQWCHGTTPYPLVNACMRQLNATGYMSNRGRQIVASALIHELGLDWRCGAAYFEQQLIDYDPASNWGNWQYIAGVGADPRGGRHFNIEKQAKQYDPHGEFVAKWIRPDEQYRLDYVDAADWPIL